MSVKVCCSVSITLEPRCSAVMCTLEWSFWRSDASAVAVLAQEALSEPRWGVEAKIRPLVEGLRRAVMSGVGVERTPSR